MGQGFGDIYDVCVLHYYMYPVSDEFLNLSFFLITEIFLQKM
jgi:hypothetical protein